MRRKKKDTLKVKRKLKRKRGRTKKQRINCQIENDKRLRENIYKGRAETEKEDRLSEEPSGRGAGAKFIEKVTRKKTMK